MIPSMITAAAMPYFSVLPIWAALLVSVGTFMLATIVGRLILGPYDWRVNF